MASFTNTRDENLDDTDPDISVIQVGNMPSNHKTLLSDHNY